jgi:predicted anti-sigma-YlaC factor YlaD
MECTRIREACSAVLDNETSELTPRVIEQHLRSCGACRQFAADARSLRTALAHTVAPAPDFSTRIAAGAGTRREPTLAVLRLGLATVAVIQIALALPDLILGSDEGAPIHIAHEVGAWGIALAVGFLFAAWRPLRAVGMLPFAAALSAGLLTTAFVDVLDGRASSLIETTHVLALIGTGLLWMLVAPRTRRRAVLRVV